MTWAVIGYDDDDAGFNHRRVEPLDHFAFLIASGGEAPGIHSVAAGGKDVFLRLYISAHGAEGAEILQPPRAAAERGAMIDSVCLRRRFPRAEYQAALRLSSHGHCK